MTETPDDQLDEQAITDLLAKLKTFAEEQLTEPQRTFLEAMLTIARNIGVEAESEPLAFSADFAVSFTPAHVATIIAASHATVFHSGLISRDSTSSALISHLISR